MLYASLIIMLLAGLTVPVCDGDTFFHLSAGKYISQNGFPTTDPFSIHDISYSPHEWLSDVIFYRIYEYSGHLGLVIFQYAVVLTLLYLTYKAGCLVCSSKPLVFILSAVQVSILSTFYITIRPQIITYIIFITEAGVMEYYRQTKNRKSLLVLPLLALLLANVHIGTFPLFIIITLPYLADMSLKINISRLRSSASLSATPEPAGWLGLALLMSAAMCMLNPYGIRKVSYFSIIFTSDVTKDISEWLCPDFKTILGMTVLFALASVLLLMLMSRETIMLKDFLLLLGLGFMTLHSIRHFSYYLLLCGIPCLSYLSSMQKNPDSRLSESVERLTRRRGVSVLVLAASVLILGLRLWTNQTSLVNLEAFPVKAVEYLKENTDYRNIRLFNEYSHGGYIMWQGIKVFVDPRADLYVPEYNKGCTVLKDYRDIYYGKVHYSEVLDKYKLDHALVSKEKTVDTYLNRDQGWRKIYGDESFEVFERVR